MVVQREHVARHGLVHGQIFIFCGGHVALQRQIRWIHAWQYGWAHEFDRGTRPCVRGFFGLQRDLVMRVWAVRRGPGRELVSERSSRGIGWPVWGEQNGAFERKRSWVLARETHAVVDVHGRGG